MSTERRVPDEHVKAAERFISQLRAEIRSHKTPSSRVPVVRAALGAACITRDLLLTGRTLRNAPLPRWEEKK